MGKNTKRTTAKKNPGTANATTPVFIIPAVEGDICRKHMSTEEICRKYMKTEEELHTLIQRAYHSSESRVKQIMRALENNDKQYNLRKQSLARKEERAMSVQTNIAAKAQTPLELQEEAVEAAQTDLFSKTQAWNTATAELKKAKEDKARALENLAQAKNALRDAEDREMQAISKENSTQEALQASRVNYDRQVELLNELSTKKLVHISAIKSGLPSGKLYMSAHDYAQLSAEDQKKVTPVSTEDSAFAHYPDDFYMYPAKLGMEGYQSAYNYALAYVKLILEAQDEAAVELVCNDPVVEALATMQNA